MSIDETIPISLNDCIEAAKESPLARDGEKSANEFYDVLRIGAHDDGSDWHKISAAGHLARAFLGMLQTAQDEGVTPRQIHLAVYAELQRHNRHHPKVKAKMP